MSDVVYHVPNTNGGTRRYHTDKECAYLNTGNKILEKERKRVPDHFMPCKYCQGYRGNGPSKESLSLQRLLKESNPEDVGLSPMEE